MPKTVRSIPPVYRTPKTYVLLKSLMEGLAVCVENQPDSNVYHVVCYMSSNIFFSQGMPGWYPKTALKVKGHWQIELSGFMGVVGSDVIVICLRLWYCCFIDVTAKHFHVKTGFANPDSGSCREWTDSLNLIRIRQIEYGPRVTITHIPWHQFLNISFSVFLRTDRQTLTLVKTLAGKQVTQITPVQP